MTSGLVLPMNATSRVLPQLSILNVVTREDELAPMSNGAALLQASFAVLFGVHERAGLCARDCARGTVVAAPPVRIKQGVKEVPRVGCTVISK